MPGLGKAEAIRAVESMIAAITGELEGGEDVRLPGFGIFSVATSAARDGRNAFAGEKIRIAAKLRVKFTAGKALQEALNQERLTGMRRRA